MRLSALRHVASTPFTRLAPNGFTASDISTAKRGAVLPICWREGLVGRAHLLRPLGHAALQRSGATRTYVSKAQQELRRRNPSAAANTPPPPPPGKEGPSFGERLVYIAAVASFFVVPVVVWYRHGDEIREQLNSQKNASAASSSSSAAATAAESSDQQHQQQKGQEQGLVSAADPSPAAVDDQQQQPEATSTVNPFIYDSPLTLYEKVKLTFGALVLLPIRVTLLVPALFLTYLLAKLSVVGLPRPVCERIVDGRTELVVDNNAAGPIPAWRRVVFLNPCRLLVRYIMFLMGFHSISIKGRPASKREAPIVVANHVSFVDPFYLFIAYLPAFVAKKDVENLPVVGTVALALQCLLVDRRSITSRKDTLDLICRRAGAVGHGSAVAVEQKEQDGPAPQPPDDEQHHHHYWQQLLAHNSVALGFSRFLTYLSALPKVAYQRQFGEDDYAQVVIFPEGTTTNGKALITFHQGAFVPGVPLQPVLIKYPHRHFDPSFPVGISLARLMLSLLCQITNHLEVEFLDVYRPSDQEQKDPALYAHNVRNLMAERLGVEVTEYTYEDALLMVEALALNMKPDRVNIPVQRVKKLYQEMTLKDLKELLWRFRHIDRDGDGLISYAEFAHSLRLPEDSAYTRDLFSLLDTDETGAIDFRKFVVGMSSLNRKVNKQQIIELAFTAFDKEGRGFIERGQLRDLLHEVFPTIGEDQLDALFNAADADKDGLISQADFVRLAEEQPCYVGIMENATRNHHRVARDATATSTQ